jgi:tRNA(fMet)-specific endonuclease VapC
MKYVLDTDTISFYLKAPWDNVRLFNRIERVDNDDLASTVVNFSELSFGYKAIGAAGEKKLSSIRKFLNLFTIYELSKEAADIYTDIKADLYKSGKLLDDADLMIAAITMANDATLVTHNTKHFSRIKGLKLEDWCV